MQARPKEFEFNYVALEFIDEDINEINSIKNDLSKDKRVKYVNYESLKAIPGIPVTRDCDVLTIITEDVNPIAVFTEVAKKRCDFISGFENVSAEYVSHPPSEHGVFRRRCNQYLGNIKPTRTDRTFESE